MTTTSCTTCEPALVRIDREPPYDIDIAATTKALAALAACGRIAEVSGDVPLDDMLDLFVSEKKYTIVSYLECRECRRTIFWGLCIRGAPIFKYVDAAEADAHG